MRLIIGLGNPGEKYQKNRHNLGFGVVEKIAQKRGVVFRLEPIYLSRFAEMGDLNNRIKIVEPQTFMNNSGKAVSKIKNYWKVNSEDIWVVYDEVDLSLGKIKVQLGGSSAGHKGLESIIETIGKDFWRIRIGIGKNSKIPTEKWVLKNFTPEEEKKLRRIIDQIADLVLKSLSRGIKEETINISTKVQNFYKNTNGF